MKKPVEILCVTLLIVCILLNLYRASKESYRCPCGIRRKTG